VKVGVWAILAVVVVLVWAPAGAPTNGPTAATRAPLLYKNRTNFNKRYPHGAEKPTARDKTSGTPVTNSRRSTRISNTAMRWNLFRSQSDHVPTWLWIIIIIIVVLAVLAVFGYVRRRRSG
jgi:cobalamin biosynthesis Mg chelatase CobN